MRGILYNTKLGSIDSAATTNLRKIKVVADICWRAILMNRKLPPQKAVTIMIYRIGIIDGSVSKSVCEKKKRDWFQIILASKDHTYQ